jgi:hypothetical protein
MARKPQALTVEYLEQDYGRVRAIVTLDDGSVLVDRVYKNRDSANSSVRQRLIKEGLQTVSITRIRPEDTQAEVEVEVEVDQVGALEPQVALVPLPAGPGVSTAQDLLQQLREASQAALQAVVALRAQADALEADAKRLGAAADILEGPEVGHGQA